MPITYRVVEEHSAVLVRVTGSLSRDDLIHFLRALSADSRVPVDHVTLFDTSLAGTIEMSVEDIEAIAAFTKSGGAKLAARKLAIVVTQTAGESLAKEYQRLAVLFGETALVFFHSEVACRWLGVPVDV